MKRDLKTLRLVPKPKVLLDKHGYPTKSAINYLKNWCSSIKEDDYLFGKYFGDTSKLDSLIEYLKEIWWYADMGIDYEDGKLWIHSLGWSGNEQIIQELKTSFLWLMYWRTTHVGGHYLFDLSKDRKEFDYDDEAYNSALSWYTLGMTTMLISDGEFYNKIRPYKENFKKKKDD